MTKKTRKLVFYILILGFVATASGFLLYALGWSLNQTTNGTLTFQKTGAVFLKTQPADALIKINGQPYTRKHGLLNNGSSELIKGLLPGNYQIEVFKENFGSWQKNLTIEAGVISSATKIFLFPKEVPTELVPREEAEKFWLTDNKKEEIKKLFYSLKQKQLKMPGAVPLVQISAFPFDTTKIIIASQKALYFLDRRNFTLELLALVPAQILATNGSEIVFLDKENNLQFYDLATKKITKKTPLLLKEEVVKITFSKVNTKVGLLTKEGRLFIYDRAKAELKLVAENIKEFRFSLDNKKMAVLNQTGEIEVIFLEDYQRDFKMTAGEKLKLNLSEEQPLDLDWLPQIPEHLIIRYPEVIAVAEVDRRPPTNWWPLAQNITDFAFDKENNLYFLKDNQFLKVNLDIIE